MSIICEDGTGICIIDSTFAGMYGKLDTDGTVSEQYGANNQNFDGTYKRVNMVNKRKEFFHVSLEEIENVVKSEFNATVVFTKVALAEQFRETQKMIEQNSKSVISEKVEMNLGISS